uniref:Sperm associated antigen 1 n=1 Tax=Mastacembelus armatus TaxID=205130 RepID=A0A7N8X6S9_9TELE
YTDNDQPLFSLQNQSTSITSRGKVPVEHLDYDYIEKCKDVKYLEKILKVLRSGEEGIYPHLIQFCESHLEKLYPKSHTLRKENCVATAASLSKDEWSQIVDELKTWQEETKKAETSLRQQSDFDDLVDKDIPPIRGSNCSTSHSKEKRNSSKHPLPRDYREWDKFDVEKECEKTDGNTKVDATCNILCIESHINFMGIAKCCEKLLLANREKVKGNEAFRASDYEEAIAYYSRSLSIIPTVAAYNNRAQAEINLKHWHNAMRDCQSVLKLEPGNMKGAFLFVEHTVQLLSDIEKLKKCQPHHQNKGKKIFIQEVEEEDDNPNNEPKAELTGRIFRVPSIINISVLDLHIGRHYKQASGHS